MRTTKSILLGYLFLQACLRYDERMDWGYDWYFYIQMALSIFQVLSNDIPSRVGRMICEEHSLPEEIHLFVGYVQCLQGLIIQGVHTRLMILSGMGGYLVVISELPDLLLSE